MFHVWIRGNQQSNISAYFFERFSATKQEMKFKFAAKKENEEYINLRDSNEQD